MELRCDAEVFAPVFTLQSENFEVRKGRGSIRETCSADLMRFLLGDFSGESWGGSIIS